MKISDRIFKVLFINTCALTVGVIGILYFCTDTFSKLSFKKSYGDYNGLAISSISEIDAGTDLHLQTALKVLQVLDKRSTPFSNEEMDRFRKELKVDQIFVADIKGNVIRSTYGDTKLTPNLFFFCEDYHTLLAKPGSINSTALIPTYPYPGGAPYKFAHGQNLAGNRFIWVALRSDWVGNWLTTSLSKHNELKFMGLYTPNGKSLGQYGEGSTASDSPNTLKELSGVKDEKTNRYVWITKIIAASPDCCQCRKFGFIDGNGQYFYWLKLEIEAKDIIFARNITIYLILGLTILAIFAVWLISENVRKSIKNSITSFSTKMSSILKSGDLTSRIDAHLNDDFSEIAASFNQSISSLDEVLKEKKINEKIITIGTLAQQVSHDIRSPLAALEMISSSLNELPIEKRQIIGNSINRIRDIANSLLSKNKAITTSTKDQNSIDIIEKSKQTEKLTVSLLNPIIESIITEERLQYSNKPGIIINYNQTSASYGLFASIQKSEFQRILSNLINNSVEAFIDQKGTVDLTLNTNSSNQIELTIKDNGKGIPEGILNKIGTRGETYGKENGTGLGLFHAIETIHAFNGDLKIDSKENIGTIITITLPNKEPPSWFVPKICLKNNQTVIVFDDDPSIHAMWTDRISSLPGQNINLLHFSNPNELRKFYGKNFTDLDEALFLMDYEIEGHSESGLNIIEALAIQKQSILVTSSYEEKNVLDRCESLGVRLIPKSMSGFVPIEVVN